MDLTAIHQILVTTHYRDDEVTSEEWTQQMRDMLEARKRGDFAFHDKDFKASIECYTQHYIKLTELEKNRKLNDLLDALDFNQVAIFVKSVSRAIELDKLLVECNFPSICIHSAYTLACHRKKD
ncbi:hypothetical protein Cni_G13702 [Canna indica]|uniref:Serine/threonine-protein kinase BSK1-like TPR repeats domain-containing protein n=1 Tax=Canna indica TaxID=4628 RepID=A0AAQ3QBR0_9LILI|nr:hypothetical protein Cni_G13702 [Canna indica]